MSKKKKNKGGYRHRGPDQLRTRTPDRARVLPLFDALGGMRPGAAQAVHEQTGLAEAEAYGVGSFYHLVAQPEVGVRVCQGLSCRMKGSAEVLEALKSGGHDAVSCECLAQCDRAPATLWTEAHGYRISRETATHTTQPPARTSPSSDALAIDLAGADDLEWPALAAAKAGADVVAQLEASGIRGRGGAGFPAYIKWRAVASETSETKYIICNADEGEPGTFKDREVLERRPHLVLEGMALAAHATGATQLIIYLRGEFVGPRDALESAIATARARGHLDGLEIELAMGHGAYICGEETALMEALEGRRGMPRHKPPFPTQSGLWGKPTLMNNVETFACVPGIVTRGGAWFEALGLGDAAGTKLYSISGDVRLPGVYELPQGSPMSALIEVAGGVVGTLLAFSPGGASSGFLPASMVEVALDFGPLQACGSMLGSAGVVVLNDTRDIAQSALAQAEFFRGESCGQCAPCRIGTQVVARLLEAAVAGEPLDVEALREVAWAMDAGSICGLGMAAPTSALHLVEHFLKTQEHT